MPFRKTIPATLTFDLSRMDIDNIQALMTLATSMGSTNPTATITQRRQTRTGRPMGRPPQKLTVTPSDLEHIAAGTAIVKNGRVVPVNPGESSL